MDSFPACLVCHQHFTLKGPAPYLLPCLHAVCDTCVTSTAGGVISCFTCQREVNLTETHVQKDVVRQREIFHLTVQHRPSELLCTHEDDGNQAVCWCQECEEFYCENCQNLHDSFKAFKKHSVENVSDITPGSLEYEEYCSIHKKIILEFWDKSCDIQICARCRLGDHAEHDVEDMDEAADVAKAEISEQEKQVQDAVSSHNSNLDTIKGQIRSTDETSQALEDTITATFHSLKVLLDQREKELLIALEQHKEKIKANLDCKTTVSQSRHRRCKMTMDYIHKALLYCSKHDLLLMKKMIGETSRECLISNPPEDQEDLCLPVFNTDSLDKTKSTISSFGSIQTTREFPEQQHVPKDAGTQTASEALLTGDELLIQHRKLLEQLLLPPFQSKVEELQTRVEDIVKKNNRDAKEVFKMWLTDKTNLDQEFTTHRKMMNSLEEDVRGCSKTVGIIQQNLNQIGLIVDGSYHLLEASTATCDKPIILLCTQLKFNCDKVNINKVHINTAGDLVNKPNPKLHDDSKERLVKYWGTTSTVPLPRCGSPQYWEVRGRVDIVKTLNESNLLLETGVCIEEERDQHHSIDTRPQSYCLNVSHCTKHSSICRSVWRHGKYVKCLPDTLINTPGQSTTLHYGVVFDDARCAVAFLDVAANTVISTLNDVDCSRPLWPVFGVYYIGGSVSMSLVVGNDIDMTEGKKDLIKRSLS